MDERADGDPQDTFDVVDERAQQSHVASPSDQTGLLGEFADDRVLEGFPSLHAAAGQFEGAAAVSAQQDALLAEQDRTDTDGRVGPALGCCEVGWRRAPTGREGAGRG
ncbi:hypothetical protein BIV24_15735 [Streptomyces colonosanans]|uniref:Uncharacterized protein n=1 Tax=Streptomyces colonosanans TaxID=1428652 RepID=A0A1S2PDF8_9ACTN|nr:hypothetical protein BIV24_15735 [Streptomyces colonosanans]